jgi:two-component system sensor histidine kinase/response regulator
MSDLVDRDSLLDRVDGDLEFLEETVDLLESDGRGLVAQLRAASAASNQDGMVRKAHTLKGMVSNFCADSVERAAEEIEHAARRGELDGIPAKVEGFGELFDRLCKETRAMLSGEGA